MEFCIFMFRDFSKKDVIGMSYGKLSEFIWILSFRVLVEVNYMS